jgi:hypothetical protein
MAARVSRVDQIVAATATPHPTIAHAGAFQAGAAKRPPAGAGR